MSAKRMGLPQCEALCYNHQSLLFPALFLLLNDEIWAKLANLFRN